MVRMETKQVVGKTRNQHEDIELIITPLQLLLLQLSTCILKWWSDDKENGNS